MPYTYLRGVAGDDSVDFVAAPAPGVMFAAGDGNDTCSAAASPTG